MKILGELLSRSYANLYELVIWPLCLLGNAEYQIKRELSVETLIRHHLYSAEGVFTISTTF